MSEAEQRSADNSQPGDRRPQNTDTARQWITAVDLVADSGYKPDAIIRLFGEPAAGPDGVLGWAEEHVTNIEEATIRAAVEVLESSLYGAEIFKLLACAPGSRSAESRPHRNAAAELLAANGLGRLVQ